MGNNVDDSTIKAKLTAFFTQAVKSGTELNSTSLNSIFDGDDDGNVSVEDFLSSAKKAGYDDDKTLSYLSDILDANSDGNIEQDELSAYNKLFGDDISASSVYNKLYDQEDFDGLAAEYASYYNDDNVSIYTEKLHSSMAGLGTDEDSFYEVLNDTNISDDDWVKILQSYQKTYNKSLINDIDGDFSGSEQASIISSVTKHLVQAAENGNEDAIYLLCQELYNTTAGRLGTMEDFVNEVINQSSDELLALITKYYEIGRGSSSLQTDIANDFSSDIAAIYNNRLADALIAASSSITSDVEEPVKTEEAQETKEAQETEEITETEKNTVTEEATETGDISDTEGDENSSNTQDTQTDTVRDIDTLSVKDYTDEELKSLIDDIEPITQYGKKRETIKQAAAVAQYYSDKFNSLDENLVSYNDGSIYYQEGYAVIFDSDGKVEEVLIGTYNEDDGTFTIAIDYNATNNTAQAYSKFLTYSFAYDYEGEGDITRENAVDRSSSDKTLIYIGDSTAIEESGVEEESEQTDLNLNDLPENSDIYNLYNNSETYPDDKYTKNLALDEETSQYILTYESKTDGEESIKFVYDSEGNLIYQTNYSLNNNYITMDIDGNIIERGSVSDDGTFIKESLLKEDLPEDSDLADAFIEASSTDNCEVVFEDGVYKLTTVNSDGNNVVKIYNTDGVFLSETVETTEEIQPNEEENDYEPWSFISSIENNIQEKIYYDVNEAPFIVVADWSADSPDDNLDTLGKIVSNIYGVDFYSKEGQALFKALAEKNPEVIDINDPDTIVNGANLYLVDKNKVLNSI